jgi:ArsR family transcriptional regulator, arsenate/arsenite/antimonite-responsive transcriptional repressor / arsenate reductase (thioredoxin)
MSLETQAAALAAMGHPARLAVLRLLARRAPGAVPASEIAGVTGVGASTLSSHLDLLVRARLAARERRGRSILYRLDAAGAGALVEYLAADCWRGRPDIAPPEPRRRRLQESDMAQNRPFEVLFICTGNSARSIFAEALANQLGGGKLRAHSAGTKAAAEVNPRALALLRQSGVPTEGLRAKSVAEFQGPGAPVFDFVFTVCDRSANEDCPPWPGQPISAHWGVPDPVKVEGAEAEKALAFSDTFRTLRHRIAAFAALPLEALDRISLQRRVDEIAALQPGAEAKR